MLANFIAVGFLNESEFQVIPEKSSHTFPSLGSGLDRRFLSLGSGLDRRFLSLGSGLYQRILSLGSGLGAKDFLV